MNKAYPKYKPSGVEWLGDVPEHWEVVSLRHLFDIKAGGDLKEELYSEEKTEKHLYPIYTNSIKSNETYGFSSKPFFKSDTITVTGRGEIGYATYRDHEYDAIIRLLVLTPKKGIPCKYYAYFINSMLNFFGGSTAVSQLSTEQISPYKVFTPSLPEQQAIAAFLDRETGRIDTLITKKQRLLELLAEQRTALISRAVTKGLDATVKLKPSGVEWLGEVPEHWEALPLRRIVMTVKTGGTPTGVEESAFDDEGFNWYSPSDFSDNIKLGKSNRALSEDGKTEVRIFPPKTVMIVGIGATIGKVGLAINESSCNQQINGIICGKWLNPEFATYYLKTMREFIVKCGKYTTLPIINQDETKNLIFTLPPLPEQQAIAAFLDRETAKIDALSTRVNTLIDRLKEYRTSLISSAVTGKIDVRGKE